MLAKYCSWEKNYEFIEIFEFLQRSQNFWGLFPKGNVVFRKNIDACCRGIHLQIFLENSMNNKKGPCSSSAGSSLHVRRLQSIL